MSQMSNSHSGLKRRRRLLFIAYHFAPSLEMGARSCAQIARYLPLHGWSPVVLTAREKYIEERYRGSDDEVAELGLPDAPSASPVRSLSLDQINLQAQDA